MKDMSSPRFGHACWVSQGKIFVAGGKAVNDETGPDLAAMDFDFSKAELQAHAQGQEAPNQEQQGLNQPQGQAQAQAPQPAPVLDTIEVYDISSNSWSSHGKNLI